MTNAGFGGNLTESGKLENEAGFSFYQSKPYRLFGSGAIAGIANVQNPIQAAISLAKTRSNGPDNFGRIMPMLLAGQGAMDFCQKIGLYDENCPKSEKSQKSFEKYKNLINDGNISIPSEPTDSPNLKRKISSNDNFERPRKIEKSSDTIGVVAIFSSATKIVTCAASSSGGFLLKRDGRIGSAATVGAGFWAEENSAAVASGNGEAIMLQERVLKI